MNLNFWRTFGGVLVLTAGTHAIQADVFDLTAILNCGSLCGKVTVAQDGKGVDVNVVLQPDVDFVRAGNHNAFSFDLGGIPVNFSGVTSGFSVVPGGGNNQPFGTFEYALSCTGCGPGGSNPLHGPLSFTITPSSGTISVASFNKVGGVFFAADIISQTGTTGATGAPGPVPPVPEPSTVGLFGTGMIAAFYMLARRG